MTDCSRDVGNTPAATRRPLRIRDRHSSGREPTGCGRLGRPLKAAWSRCWWAARWPPARRRQTPGLLRAARLGRLRAHPVTAFLVDWVHALERPFIPLNEVSSRSVVLHLSNRSSPTTERNVWKIGIGHAGPDSNAIANAELEWSFRLGYAVPSVSLVAAGIVRAPVSLEKRILLLDR